MLQAGALLDVAGGVAALGVAALAWSLSRAPRWRRIRLIAWIGGSGVSYFFFDLHTAIPGVPGFWRSAANGLDVASLSLHIGAWILLRTRLLQNTAVDTLDRVLLSLLTITGVASAIPGVAFVPGEVERASQLGSIRYYDVQPTAAGNVAFAVLMVVMGLALGRYLKDVRKGDVTFYHVAALGLLFAGAVHDVLVSAAYLSPPYVAGPFFFAAILCVGADFTRGFIGTANSLDRLALDLEQRVKERTAALEKATETLRQTERLATLGQLAGGVAHEINNPISAVIGNLTVLQEARPVGSLTEEEHACLTDSLEAARRVARIVKQLQQAGSRTRAQDARVTIDVGACVRAAVETARASSRGAVKIDIDCPDGTFATGEHTMLEQVIENLVQNGVQAIPDGQKDGRVEVRVEAHAQGGARKVRIAVTDNGVGMSASTKERLFEPFFSTKPAGLGTGLGLAVSSTFVTAMRGEMRVESTLGRGSELSIELDAAGAPKTEAASASPARTEKRRRVLLVDDDPQVLSMHARQLGPHCDVDTASTVKDALERAARERYDAVICDLTMPDGGGERLLLDLRAAGSPLADRTLLITGGARGESDEELIERLGSRVLRKPCGRSELVDAIERVVARTHP